MTQRKGLRGILALLCAMTLLIGAIGPAGATEAVVPESVAVTTAAAPENTPAPSAQATKAVITSWQWVDPNGYLKAGALELSTGEGPVDYSGVTVMLPTAITASVDGKEGVNISVVNWLCNEFTAPATSGEFTFKAEIAKDYTLGENVPALEVKVKLIPQQPVADAPADTTGNTTAPAAPTPPTTEKVTAPKCSCEIRCAQDAVKADCPVCSAEGAKLDEVCTGAAPVTLEEKPQSLASGMILYVGDQNITADGYWTTDNDGNITAYTGEGAPTDNYIHYAADTNTLTLHNATIKESVPYTTSTLLVGAAIGVLNQYGDAGLTIKLEGTNTIAKVGTGIYVLAPSSSASNATLTIEGDGSLDASASQTGILVQGNSCDAALSIKNAKVTATLVDSYGGDGVRVQSGENSSASLTVNGGSLAATGSGATFAGIQLQFGSGSSGSGTPSVAVSDNAIVRANGGVGNNSSTEIQFGAGPGIVFDGKNGTVYGNVELDKNLTINEGETLTIPDGASLTTNDKLIVKGGTVNGNVTGKVTYLVTGVTLDKDQLTLLPGDSDTLKATVTPDNASNKSVKWVSDKPEFATVDQQGTVTAVKSGTATITATAADGSGKSASCTVTVNSGISANPAALDFGSVATNYSAAPKAQTVTITNNTKVEVTLNQPTATNYVISDLPELKLASKGTATFTVQPKTGLLQGEYQETIKVSSTAGDVSFDVSFNVVQLKLSFQNYTGKIYDGKPMANPTKDQLTVTGADFSEVTFTWYKDTKAEENKLTSAPTDAGTYVLVAAVAKTDSHDAAEAQQTITIAKADATDAMKKAEGTLTKNHESSLTLPTLPDGASYGTPTGNGTYVTDLRVSDGKLAYKGTSNVVNDGKYEVKVPVLNAKNYNNYDITVTFTGQEKLPVTLTAANFTTTYNGSEVFPEAIHKTATYDGQAVNGTWSFVGGNPKNAGTYKDIELKFTPNSDKYATASIKLDVVIKKAPLKVSVKLSKTKIAVNSKLPTVSLGYSGLVGNEKLDPDVEPKFEGMPTGKKTGTYTISLKNVDEVKEAINALSASENYDITYVTSAKLSVVSGNNPLTADTSHIGMWTAIMVISGIGLIVVLVVMVVMNKKSKRRRPRYRRTPPKQEEE